MNIYVYIAAMAITTYLIRMLPLTIFRKPIKSRFLRSFLYYVPYACLTAMTFPLFSAVPDPWRRALRRLLWQLCFPIWRRV